VAGRSIRDGLRRLAVGLIAYGIAGLVVAALAASGTVWLAVRVGDLTDRAAAQVTSNVATLDRTSTALTDAGASATSFAATMDETPPAVRQAAQAIGDLRGNLRSIEDQFGRIDILGRRPLGDVASQFGQMATDLDGLDTRLALIATDLDANRAALRTNAASLGALGQRLTGVAADLRSAGGAGDLGDLRTMILVVAALLVVWMALPAAGALWLGWWLRRQLGSDQRRSWRRADRAAQ
jgi:hypothetical protein